MNALTYFPATDPEIEAQIRAEQAKRDAELEGRA